MELGKIDVILYKQSCIYAPGELLEGRLEIDLPFSKRVKCIYIKFHGEGAVRYRTSMVISNSGKTQNVLSYADEKYAQYTYLCLKNSGSSALLAKGKHIYPFGFHLPYDIPSTFRHEYGTIRYFLKVVLDPSGGFKQRFFKDVCVKTYIDLNRYPNLDRPHIISLKKNVSFLWFDNVKLKINVKLRKTGYSVGETLPIYTEVINNSEKMVLNLTFNLQQSIVFSATTPKKDSKTVTTNLVKSIMGPHPPRNCQYFNHELVVPNIPHEDIGGSKIINIKHYLEVTAIREGGEEISETIPLSIGINGRNN